MKSLRSLLVALVAGATTVASSTHNKSYLAAIGLVGLAVYQYSQGDYDQAAKSLLLAAAVAGLRNETAPPASAPRPPAPPIG